MDRGDELAAAMFGALAFEQMLRDLNRKHDIGFDFRVPHHNRAFLDRLASTGKVDTETLGRLRSLKSRRDTFTHRMHHIASLPESRRSKVVKRYLGELAEANGVNAGRRGA